MRLLQLTLGALIVAGCAHVPADQARTDCHVEAGWLDSTSGCSATAGYPDCYRVCRDGSRVRVENEGYADMSPKTQPPRQ